MKKAKGIKSSTHEKEARKTRDKRTKSAPVGRNGRYRKTASLKELLMFICCFFGVVSAILYYFYQKYGIDLFLGHGSKDYKLSPYEWRELMDKNEKTVLIIGGPHRSGTTIVWKAISQHPEVAGFGDRFETGADYSEGVLMQDVYPSFGVGTEFIQNWVSKNTGEDGNSESGLGRFALLPESTVHWTKENKQDMLQDSKTMAKLLNRFAPYWDTSRQYNRTNGLMNKNVWVEKSPQNGVMTSFLEGLYNMPVNENGSVDTSRNLKSARSVTKFLFMTRDPIANVYATDKFIRDAMGGFVDFDTLMRNYIQLHEYMQMDSKQIDSEFMWVRLEDFVSSPEKTLTSIFSFLGVAIKENDDVSAASRILGTFDRIHSDPNKKYIDQWCREGQEEHKELLKYNSKIKNLNLGYDLTKLCPKIN